MKLERKLSLNILISNSFSNIVSHTFTKIKISKKIQRDQIQSSKSIIKEVWKFAMANNFGEDRSPFRIHTGAKLFKLSKFTRAHPRRKALIIDPLDNFSNGWNEKGQRGVCPDRSGSRRSAGRCTDQLRLRRGSCVMQKRTSCRLV